MSSRDLGANLEREGYGFAKNLGSQRVEKVVREGRYQRTSSEKE